MASAGQLLTHRVNNASARSARAFCSLVVNACFNWDYACSSISESPRHADCFLSQEPAAACRAECQRQAVSEVPVRIAWLGGIASEFLRSRAEQREREIKELNRESTD